MDMKRLNNKGYMLIEIILASVIAFLVIYFIIDLTVKMKNKNDDMFVKTLVTTDQTIVTKKLMDYALVEQEEFDCGSLKIDGRSILYKDEVITVISDYADVGSLKCSNEFNKISIFIPLDVKQQVDEDFDIVIDYRYDLADATPPEMTFSLSGQTAVVTCKDPETGIKSGERKTQNLSGTSNIKVTHECVNNVGLVSTGSHTYRYDGCLTKGPWTCRGGYDYGSTTVCTAWYEHNPNSPGCGSILGCAACHSEPTSTWNPCKDYYQPCYGGFKY